jgi:hypothetical protein
MLGRDPFKKARAQPGSARPEFRDYPLPSPSPPSPPSSLEGPLVGPPHRHLFKMCVLPRTTAMDQAEEAITSALVAVIGGDRPVVSLP